MKVRYLLTAILIIIPAMTIAAEDITLVTDPVWNRVLEIELIQNPAFRITNRIKELVPVLKKTGAVRIEGKRIDRYIIEASRNEIDSIKEAVEKIEGFVILSPMFAVYGCELAETYNELYFFVPCDKPPADCSCENLVYFVFNFSEAFYEAGRWAANQPLDVSAVFYTGEKSYKERSLSFKEGWQSVRSLEELQIREITRLDRVDKDFIEDFQSSLPNDGGVAAVFAGSQNSALIEVFDGSPVKIAGEYLYSWTDSGFNTAASIEIGPDLILSGIVKSISTDSYIGGNQLMADFFLYDSDE